MRAGARSDCRRRARRVDGAGTPSCERAVPARHAEVRLSKPSAIGAEAAASLPRPAPAGARTAARTRLRLGRADTGSSCAVSLQHAEPPERVERGRDRPQRPLGAGCATDAAGRGKLPEPVAGAARPRQPPTTPATSPPGHPLTRPRPPASPPSEARRPRASLRGQRQRAPARRAVGGHRRASAARPPAGVRAGAGPPTARWARSPGQLEPVRFSSPWSRNRTCAVAPVRDRGCRRRCRQACCTSAGGPGSRAVRRRPPTRNPEKPGPRRQRARAGTLIVAAVWPGQQARGSCTETVRPPSMVTVACRHSMRPACSRQSCQPVGPVGGRQPRPRDARRQRLGRRRRRGFRSDPR